MSLPVVEFASSMAATATANGVQTRTWPTGHQPNWVSIVGVVTPNQAVGAPGTGNALHLAGFTEVVGSPIGIGTAGAAGSIRLSLYWKRATTTAEQDIKVYNIGTDWFGFACLFLSNVLATGTPILTGVGFASATVTPASATVSIPSIDTTGFTDCMVLAFAADAIDSGVAQFGTTWTNASLANLIQRINQNTAAGTGGGFTLITGEKTTAGVVSATTGTLNNSSQQAKATLAIRGTAGSVVVPDSDFCCGGEAGESCTGPSNAHGSSEHWHTQQGAKAISQTAIARNNSRGLRFVLNNEIGYQGRTVTGSQRVFRGYLRFNTLPSGDTELVRFHTQSDLNPPELRYKAATGTINAGCSGGLSSGKVVVPGVFYRIDITTDVSVNPRTMNFQVDGTAIGSVSKVATQESFDEFQIGGAIESPTSVDLVWDDIRIGANPAAYPFGDSAIIGRQLTADGTHNFGAATDFLKNNLTQIPIGTTDTWSFLTGLLVLENFARSLAAAGVSAGEYLEWLHTGAPSVTAIKAVEVITAHAGSNTNPHKQTLRIIDGATTQDIFTDLDFAGQVVKIYSAHFAKAPSGVAWTQALLNAIKYRWGSSWTAVDIDSVPLILGLFMEVDCTGLTAPPSEGSTVQNPTHTFAAAGTYNVTLTVTDDDGATGSVTKAVVVP